MALYDNKLWLLSHIHNSFISSDDSGVCELILGSDNFKDELRVVALNQGLPSFTDCISDEEDEDVDGFRRSPDIRGGSQWLKDSSPLYKKGDKPVAVKVAPEKPKTIAWKPGNPDPEEMAELFPRKILNKVNPPQVSLLTEQLNSLAVGDCNPWIEFGRFDGSGIPDEKFVRKISIYFPMTLNDLSMKPILVMCRGDARVHELIGLSCYQYTLENREPRLAPPVENYSLFMCEEDGSVDWDFPSLDSSDLLSKYGFTVLAVVERSKPEQSAICVTLHLPDGTFSQIEVQKRDITLGEILEKGLERRKRLTNVKYNFEYHLEAVDEPGITLDPSVTLSANGAEEFYIVRNNSKRVADIEIKRSGLWALTSLKVLSSGARDAQSIEICHLEALLFQSFNVEIFTKVRTKVDVHLGISEEKVEIDPRQQTSSAKFWSKQKAVSYALDLVVSCEILESKTKGDRDLFRMVYLSDSGWGQRDFEADSETARAVVQKLNYLLDLRQSNARKQRKEYLINKEKKKLKPKSATK